MDGALQEGVYTGTFTFGPNQRDNLIDETWVAAYKVWFADAALNKLGGNALATISVEYARVTMSSCGCDANYYTVVLTEVAVPSDATGIMIVVEDLYGFELPVGTYIGAQGPLDVWTTTTTTTPTTTFTSTSHTATTTSTGTTTTLTLKPVVGSAPRLALSAGTLNVWLLVGSVVVLARRVEAEFQ